MNIYIFEYVEDLTDRYHSDGGLVVVAKDDDDARAQVAEHYARQGNDSPEGPTPEEWDNVIVYPLAASCEPRLFVFPDAGCC